VANLDWNKTKTIFIIVFSILNVFLFSLYLNRYNEALDVEVQSDTPIEERLFLDNITVPKMESVVQAAAYVSGDVHNFSEDEFSHLTNQRVEIKTSDHLISTFIKPIPITEEDSLEKLVYENILHGDSYGLWKIDKENKSASFFQKVNDRFVYYNKNAKIVVYWNDQQELVGYEQTILDNLEDYNESKNLSPYMQAIKALYSRGLLKPDTTVKEISLGYSRLVETSETQVFSPTWYILAELSDGTKEEYFVNAVEGRVIDLPKEMEEAALK
jgi:regulatory protein YycI of two-component signal transduction system YycFG